MMIEITQEDFFINNNLTIDSLSYELVSKQGFKSLICRLLLANFDSKELLEDDKVSFAALYGTDIDPEVQFEENNTYRLIDIDTETDAGIVLTAEINLQDSFDNLSLYVKIFDDTDEDSYSKLFVEELVQRDLVSVGNFVDYSISETTSFLSNYKTPYELQQEFFKKNFNRDNGYSYLTDLFYHFNSSNIVTGLFGVDSKSYILDNNPVEFLNEDTFFNDYLSFTEPVQGATGYIYGEQESIFANPLQLQTDLEDSLGKAFSFSFETPKDFIRSNKYGYTTTIAFRDLVTEYINDVLLPNFRKEERLLSELVIEPGTIRQLDSSLISYTINTYQSYLAQNVDNTKDIFKFYNGSQININDQVRKILLDISRNIYKVVLDSLEAKNLLSDRENSITKDFGKNIDISNIDYGVNVLDPKESNLAVFSREELSTRGIQESEKYTKPEETPEQYFGYLTSLNLVIEGREALDNRNSVYDSFSYDQTLKYLNTINEIINKNIDKQAIIYPTKQISGLSKQEVDTEDRTEQNNLTLNSLNIVRNVNFRTAREANRSLAIRDNIIKTFQVPTTLTSNICNPVLPLNSPENNSLLRKRVDRETFVGNSLITFALLNKIKSIKNNDFYEPYFRIEQNPDADTDGLPIQAQFLSTFYTEGEAEPRYLQKENVLNEITNFGVIYHNFKSVFCVKVFLVEENDFVVLDNDTLESLETDKNYLCAIEYYKNEEYGIETPELLRTSIYNRYFILAT